MNSKLSWNLIQSSARKLIVAISKDFASILSDFFIIRLNFLMTNADVTGQKHMWINDFDLAIAGLIIQFDISIPSLQIAGDHQTSGSLAGIVSVPISGQGRVNMNVHNVHVRGIGQLVTIGGFLHLNHLVSTVVVESVDATLTGFGLLDGTVSQLVSSLSPGIVNDNQDRINNAVYAVLVPGLNNFLNNHTLTTLINLMADRNQNPPPRRCFW